MSQLEKTRQIIYLLSETLKRIFKQSYDYKIDVSGDIICKDMIYLCIKCDNVVSSNLDSILNSVILDINLKISDNDYLTSQVLINDLIEKRCLNTQLLLDDFIYLSDFNIEIDSDLLLVNLFNKQQLKESLDSLSLKKIKEGVDYD